MASFFITLPASSGGGGGGGNVNITEVGGASINLGQTTMANSFPVVIASDQSAIPVSGSITASNPSVSATGSAVPASATYVGAINSGNLIGVAADGSGHLQVVQQGTWTVQPGNTANTVAWKVDGSAVTQPVSAASLPLPTGAATSAKQPALGTAGSASTDVLTVQGIASMVALKVDGSAVTQPVSLVPRSSGGNSVFRLLSANTTNSNNIKASAGQLYGYTISNTNGSPRWLKFYNKATAPTVGTDTPFMTVMIPGNTGGAGANIAWPNGIAMGTGIGIGITTGVADSDTGAPAANEVVVNIIYN